MYHTCSVEAVVIMFLLGYIDVLLRRKIKRQTEAINMISPYRIFTPFLFNDNVTI